VKRVLQSLDFVANGFVNELNLFRKSDISVVVYCKSNVSV